MAVTCEFCGREFKNKRGLASHQRAKHPSTELRTSKGRSRKAARAKGQMTPDDLVRKACKDLGIKVKDVMSFAIYDDKLVIIEGPVGYEREWSRET